MPTRYIGGVPIAAGLLFAGWMNFPMQAQFTQGPMCGDRMGPPALENLRVTRQVGHVFSTLRITDGNHTVKVKIPGQVEQICTLSEGRYLVFAFNGVGYSTAIVDAAKGIRESFDTYSPSVSPDQHWLIRRNFYPP